MNFRSDVRSVWFWLSLAALVVLCVFLLYPLINVLASSFGSARADGKSGWQVLLSEPKYMRAVANT
ncbi:MAG: hypothetical protein ACRCUX_04665, partial [Beijerinckiaceae bacterium]